MADKLASFAAAALCLTAAFQATSLTWHALRPRDPGCAVYEDTAGKTARVALSGGEAVDTIFRIMATTRNAEVHNGSSLSTGNLQFGQSRAVITRGSASGLRRQPRSWTSPEPCTRALPSSRIRKA